jgi:pimeloyl-ACP methyl ester carboxylesterase
MNKYLKRTLKFLTVNFILFFTVSLVLIYWPVPSGENVENYDYSSIDTTSNQSLSAAREVWVKMRDGQKLFNRIYPSNSDQAIILIHGSGSESRYLSDLAKSLSEKNQALVITPDLRGHGRNITSLPDIDYIGQLENDIEDIVTYTRKNLGAKKLILAGHSSGGGLVLRYIGNNKLEKVNYAVLISPYLGHDSPTFKPNSGGWVTVGVKRWVGISMLNHLGITHFNRKPVLFFNRPKAYDDSLQVSSYSYRMAVNFAPDNFDREVRQLKTKTLVMVGDNDESFYPNRFKEVFAPAKDFVTTNIIPNANHLDIVKNDEVILKILNWISN